MAAGRLHSQKDKNQATELSMVLTNREGGPVELSIVLNDEGVDLTHRVPCKGKKLINEALSTPEIHSFSSCSYKDCNQIVGTFSRKSRQLDNLLSRCMLL